MLSDQRWPRSRCRHGTAARLRNVIYSICGSPLSPLGMSIRSQTSPSQTYHNLRTVQVLIHPIHFSRTIRSRGPLLTTVRVLYGTIAKYLTVPRSMPALCTPFAIAGPAGRLTDCLDRVLPSSLAQRHVSKQASEARRLCCGPALQMTALKRARYKRTRLAFSLLLLCFGLQERRSL